MAKCVCELDVSEKRFSLAIAVLGILIENSSLELNGRLLEHQVQELKKAVTLLHKTMQTVPPPDVVPNSPTVAETTDNNGGQVYGLICRVLDYLDEHYTDSTLNLDQVATAVGRNEKYVSHLFVQQVGQRMRAYIRARRVRHACELLLRTELTVDQVARDSGFSSSAHFRQSFRRSIGVTASRYRQIFMDGAVSWQAARTPLAQSSSAGGATVDHLCEKIT